MAVCLGNGLKGFSRTPSCVPGEGESTSCVLTPALLHVTCRCFGAAVLLVAATHRVGQRAASIMAIDHLATCAVIGTLALVSTGLLAYSLIISDYTDNSIRLPALSCHLGTPRNAHVAPGASQMSDVTRVAIRAAVFMVTAARSLGQWTAAPGAR